MSALAVTNVVDLIPPRQLRPAGLLPWEDEAAFAGVRVAFTEAYSPSGAVEASLVDRMVWIEWRRARLLAAEAAVHVAHAFDRANDSSAKTKTLIRAGVVESKVRDDVSLSEILRGSDEDDQETVAAIREGVGDVDAALTLISEAKPYEFALERLDDDMRAWWIGALEETDDAGRLKYQATIEGLEAFLKGDGLPWRQGWLKVHEIRPAIRAQAIAESLDPARVRVLWEMEARLDRQFEKALSMLIRLQEIRRLPSPLPGR